MRSLKFFLLLSVLFSTLIVNAENTHLYKAAPQNVPSKDTTYVLCIGNSFTYYYETNNMLFELAQSQGHYLSINCQTVGGYSFGMHLINEKTMRATERREGARYDIAFLQNQSHLNARIAKDPERFFLAIEDAENLSARIRMYSPDVRLIFESTWSYYKYNLGGFSSLKEFDKYLSKGTGMLAELCNGEVSPIGKAFSIIRKEKPEIELLGPDKHHQSPLGAYVKSCVNYVKVFGRFDKNASDCGFDHNTAAYIRTVAERVVFPNEGNRYGMEIYKDLKGQYQLVDAFKPLLKGDQPEGLLEPYKALHPVSSKDVSDVKAIEVVYKKYADHDLKLWIYKSQKKSKDPAPVMFFCHGGSWIAGSPASMDGFAKYMAKYDGVTTVNVQYSFAYSENIYAEDAIQDYMDAIAYVQEHASELGIDPHRLGFAGHSAGGHLSAVAAMKCPDAKVFIGWAGIYNFCTAACTQVLYRDLSYRYNPWLYRYFHECKDEALAKVSPVNMIPSGRKVAVQLYFGSCDRQVGEEQAREFGPALEAAGHKVEMKYYLHYAHGLHSNSDIAKDVWKDTQKFIKENL